MKAPRKYSLPFFSALSLNSVLLFLKKEIKKGSTCKVSANLKGGDYISNKFQCESLNIEAFLYKVEIFQRNANCIFLQPEYL